MFSPLNTVPSNPSGDLVRAVALTSQPPELHDWVDEAIQALIDLQVYKGLFELHGTCVTPWDVSTRQPGGWLRLDSHPY